MADFDQINQSKADPRTPDEIKQAHIADLVDSLMVAFDSVNQLYIQKVAEQIAVIGTLNESSINRMAILAQMNEDIAAIKKQLEKALQYTASHLNDVLTEAFKELSGPQIYEDRVVQEQPRSSSLLKRIEQLARSIGRQTMETFRNLSNTSAITKGYMEAVDKAILATTSGLASYSEAIRDVIREVGSNGMKIDYGSGHTRRLDSAARSNVLSACNQIAQQGSDIVAEETGCDCKEITVHSCPAWDHAPVQGHVLKNEEWTKMQNGEDFEDINGQEFDGFRRPIGEWNCMHFGMAFDSRYQVPKYTAKQLNDVLSQNEHGFYWRGRHYTMYQGTQMMRRYELKIREQMDIAVAAKAAGDQVLQDQAQIQIEKLSADYESLSRASGIPMNPNRIRVEGFSRYDGPKHLGYSGPVNGQNLLANTGEKIMGLNRRGTSEEPSQPQANTVGGTEEQWDQIRDLAGKRSSEQNKTDHIRDRQEERGVTDKDINSTLKGPLKIQPVKIDSDGKQSYKVIGEQCTVYINPETGSLITTHKTGSRLVAKLKKQRGDNG